MKQKNFLKFLGIYLLVFYSIAGILFWSLKKYRESNYNEAKYEKLITGQFFNKDINNNPCKFEIKGDPVKASSDYLKIYLYCKDSKSINTLWKGAYSGTSVEAGIRELARINGFDAEKLMSKFKCYLEKKEIVDFKIYAQDKGVVECYQK